MSNPSNLKKVIKLMLEEEPINQMNQTDDRVHIWMTGINKSNRSMSILIDDLNSHTNLTDYYDNIHGLELY